MAGGNNVLDRYTSDLWVHGGFAYTGTYGRSPRNGHAGDQVKIWSLDGSGTPALVNTIEIPLIANVSDVEVSDDGSVLMFSTEGNDNAGLFLYSLADPANPEFLTSVEASGGIHTATFGTIGSNRYAFAARNAAGSGAADLRRHRSDGLGAGNVGADTAGLRHPRHLRSGWACVRVRLEYRRDHLRCRKRHPGRISPVRPRK